MLAEILEFAMLFAFGFSWPFAIARTYRAKRVDGKSPAFMVIVLIGYACGIAAHVVEGTKLWLCVVYLVDMALVSTCTPGASAPRPSTPRSSWGRESHG